MMSLLQRVRARVSNYRKQKLSFIQPCGVPARGRIGSVGGDRSHWSVNAVASDMVYSTPSLQAGPFLAIEGRLSGGNEGSWIM